MIIHVEIEVTASPASEANLSAAGCLRGRFPLCQGSPARLDCHLLKNTMVFSLVVVAQQGHSTHMEREKEDLPLQDEAVAM